MNNRSRKVAVAGAAGLIAVGLHGAATADRKAPPEAMKTSGTTIPPSVAKVALREITRVEQPLAVEQRANDNTLYIVSKRGKISAFRNGAIESTAVLDISSRVDTNNERGLLGLAFSSTRPDHLYIDYTDKTGAVVVSEVPFDGRTADVARERVMLRIPKKLNEHNAGTLAFDGKNNLLIAIGDGGGSDDRPNNGQRTDTLLGKVLRIDPTPSANAPYSIPADNPFAKPRIGKATVLPEILAYGLRNPWRISVDRETGDVWVPDVGQSRYEELNRLTPDKWGANFGWRLREGTEIFRGPKPKGSLDPVYAYPHLDGRCAVVGGAFYRGSIASLKGTYIFGDVCSGAITALRRQGSKWVAENLGLQVPYLSAFGTTNDGELLAISLEGSIAQIVPA